MSDLLPSLRLDRRTAVVTGGGNGIGRETCRVLAAAGANVIVADIDVDAAKTVAEDIRRAGGSADARALDVTDPPGVDAFAANVVSSYDTVDVLVNNAGIVTMAPLLEMGDADFDAVVAVSLHGTYLMTRAMLPALRSSGDGRVISMSSMLAKTPALYTGHYAAAKAGIIAFTQSIAREAAPTVTVNCICPGSIDTGMTNVDLEFFSRIEGTGKDELVQRWIDEIPLGRLGRPCDVAWVVLFLASEAGGFMTGQAINISGGQEMH